MWRSRSTVSSTSPRSHGQRKRYVASVSDTPPDYLNGETHPMPKDGYAATLRRRGLLRGEAGVRPFEPAHVARRRATLHAPADEGKGVVVALEPEVARHHRLLEDLPLGVTAADAVHLARDGFEMGQRLGVVAGDERRGPAHQRERHRARDQRSLGVEIPQAIDQLRERRLI